MKYIYIFHLACRLTSFFLDHFFLCLSWLSKVCTSMPLIMTGQQILSQIKFSFLYIFFFFCVPNIFVDKEERVKLFLDLRSSYSMHLCYRTWLALFIWKGILLQVLLSFRLFGMLAISNQKAIEVKVSFMFNVK